MAEDRRGWRVFAVASGLFLASIALAQESEDTPRAEAMAQARAPTHGPQPWLEVTVPALVPGTFVPEDLEYTEGAHDRTIQRTWADAREAELIQRAERVPLTVEKTWQSTFDGVNVPSSLNLEVLLYYVAAQGRFEQGDFPSLPFQSTFLRYSAKLDRHERFESPAIGQLVHDESMVVPSQVFEDVEVVELVLYWDQVAGPLAKCWVKASRWVVFDDQGEILAILGDGLAEYLVS